MVFTNDRNLVKIGSRGDDTIGQLGNGSRIDLLHCYRNPTIEGHVNQY